MSNHTSYFATYLDKTIEITIFPFPNAPGQDIFSRREKREFLDGPSEFNHVYGIEFQLLVINDGRIPFYSVLIVHVEVFQEVRGAIQEFRGAEVLNRTILQSSNNHRN